MSPLIKAVNQAAATDALKRGEVMRAANKFMTQEESAAELWKAGIASNPIFTMSAASPTSQTYTAAALMKG